MQSNMLHLCSLIKFCYSDGVQVRAISGVEAVNDVINDVIVTFL